MIKNLYYSLIERLNNLKYELKIIYFKYFDKPCKEVVEANFNKLPEKIEIYWFREGRFIVGKITADNNEIMTQAESADEFVEMVNDSIIATYEIPQSCHYIIKKIKNFLPSKEQFEQLNNAAIKHSNIKLSKERNVAIA